MPATPDLAALLGSRLCHDLIGPIGAIGNGVELLRLTPAGTGDEVALIADSVTTLSARLRLFRVAFGIARPDQSFARAEVMDILPPLFPSRRVTLDWTSPASLPRTEVKAVFLLLLCAEGAMRGGGTIRILRDEIGWNLTLASPRLKADPRLWPLLTGAPLPDSLEPGEVHFALAAAALAALGRRADMETGPDSLRLSF
ncbi:histidine phosphotransferase [Rhodobacteraceae bacterium HSP-20]|uniref:Histidine phosphotransferase n=1 Tax=Paragemmobacter amnigenus TaxID=2852097 RepID=A0ABS6IZV4_9RHOB|nr:histidine phosphotransferase family protein [Rhodobacter amnigenus]MBU9697041.1 histidine phosphotransferase [Rhodobacter amnigenus]MBV4388268.1 histidine phosphotransferase [Rhodobacter amnigenus]